VFNDPLDWSLCKNSVYLVIEDGTHKTSVNVEIFNFLYLDSIMFVWMEIKVHVSTSEYLSLSF